jgi:hypothetical protein
LSSVIYLDFNKGTVKADIAALPEKMSKAACVSLNEGLNFVVMMAKILVLVDTGTLQKTIRKERGGRGRCVYRVRAGGYFTNPKTGRLCDYAHWVEMNYPYLAPAIKMGDSYIKNLIKTNVVAAVSE